MSNLTTSNRINITVGQQVFAIPVDRVNEVILLLSKLQSIQIQENPSPLLQYKGRSLLNG